MTDKLITEFKGGIKKLTLVPSDGGRFEISLDGTLIYSKLETGQFPEEDAMVAEVGNRL